MKDPCLQWSKSLSRTPSSWEISISTDTASLECEEQREYKIQRSCFSPKILHGKHWLIKVLLKCKPAFMGMEMWFRGQILDLESWARPGRMELWATEDYFLDTWMSFLGCVWELFRNAGFLYPSHSYSFSPSILAFSLPGLLSYAFSTLSWSPNEEESRLEGEVGITSRASLALGSDVLEPVWVPGLFFSVSFNGLSWHLYYFPLLALVLTCSSFSIFHRWELGLLISDNFPFWYVLWPLQISLSKPCFLCTS